MPFINERIDAYAVAALLIVIPWLYSTLPLQRIKGPQTRASESNGSVSASNSNGQVTDWTRTWLSLLIALHMFYTLYDLTVRAPYNIFTELDVSIAEPADVLRALFLYHSSFPKLPPDLDALLNRLRSFDMREKYVLFGDYPLRYCAYCDATRDFVLFALPRVMRAYIRAAIVIGMLTLRRFVGPHAARLRFWALAALVGAAAVEVYVMATVHVPFPPARTIMIHDNLYFARHTILLLLPPILYILPRIRLPWARRTVSPPSAIADLTVLPHLQIQTQQLLSCLHMLRLTSAARARSPGLSEASRAWWGAMHGEGALAREDRKVQAMAERLGVGFVDCDVEPDEHGQDGGESGESAGEKKGKGALRRQARVTASGILEALRHIQGSSSSL